MLYSPLTLVIGRQNWSYGNSLVFDSTGANNVAPGDSGLAGVAQDLTAQTALDAVRAIFDYNPLKVEVFYSLISENTATAAARDLDPSKDDKNLWGVNATYELGDELNSVVEGYFFAQKDGGTRGPGGKADYIKVVGLRGSTNPLEGLNLQAEYAFQGGNKVIDSSDTTGLSDANYQQIFCGSMNACNRRRNAHAVQFIANYQVPALEEYNPLLSYVFTKTTREDHGSNNEAWNGWDPFYEAQGGGKIYNALFDNTGIIAHEASLKVNPMEDVMTKLTFTKLWLEKGLIHDDNGHYNDSMQLRYPDDTSSALNLVQGVEDKKKLGFEVDFDTTYDYTEDVQLGLNLGWFFPQEAFGKNNRDAAKQVLANVHVAF
jgi:hypothetical protein